LATEAAARLLKHNYQECGSWPLAITAYNHGLEGMKKAMQTLNTSNIDRIVDKYRSPYFGFASRNFYCEFLAALHVVQHYEGYFGSVNFCPPVRFREFELPKYARISTLAKHLRLDRGLLSELNPALRNPIFSGTRYLPKGYRLRVPPHLDAGPLIAQIPSSELFAAQKKTNWYRVNKGDTLEEIASKHGTPLQTLVALNGLTDAHRIHTGQVIRVPDTIPSSASSSAAKILVASLSTPPSRIDARPAAAEPEKKAAAPVEKAHENGRAETRLGLMLSPAYASVPPTPRVRLVKNHRPSMGYIRAEPDETLGHYADWLKVSSKEIRRWNGLSPKRNVLLGQWIKVVFKKVTPEDFNATRLEYHREIEEDFYNNYKVQGTFTHCLTKGESIWYLCSQVYNVPYWLVIQYNSDMDLRAVKPGDTIVVPRISNGDTSS
jgi:membrane-bound lytic murein transglycosylase D